MRTNEIATAHILKLALPKGRLFDGVGKLLEAADMPVHRKQGSYRLETTARRLEAKLMTPRDVALALARGTRDLGFTGADWIAETGADVVQLWDTGYNRVRLVVAAPPQPGIPVLRHRAGGITVASRYVKLSGQWLESQHIRGEVILSSGHTEVWPPEDADCIVEVTDTGKSLAAHGLEVVEVLLESSTRLYASRRFAESSEVMASGLELVHRLTKTAELLHSDPVNRLERRSA